MHQWRRMAVYETMGFAFYAALKEIHPGYQISIADGCLDSQADDCWLWS